VGLVVVLFELLLSREQTQCSAQLVYTLSDLIARATQAGCAVFDRVLFALFLRVRVAGWLKVEFRNLSYQKFTQLLS
jgi:hypothetical protein